MRRASHLFLLAISVLVPSPTIAVGGEVVNVGNGSPANPFEYKYIDDDTGVGFYVTRYQVPTETVVTYFDADGEELPQNSVFAVKQVTTTSGSQYELEVDIALVNGVERSFNFTGNHNGMENSETLISVDGQGVKESTSLKGFSGAIVSWPVPQNNDIAKWVFEELDTVANYTDNESKVDISVSARKDDPNDPPNFVGPPIEETEITIYLAPDEWAITVCRDAINQSFCHENGAVLDPYAPSQNHLLEIPSVGQLNGLQTDWILEKESIYQLFDLGYSHPHPLSWSYSEWPLEYLDNERPHYEA